MDPFLEHPNVFAGLHDQFVVHLEEAIQPLLLEPFYAKGNRRLWTASDEYRETYVEIHKKVGNRTRLVTVIDLVLPLNRAPGEESRSQYRARQDELKDREVHHIEIDLLRGGKHVTAVKPEQLKQCGTLDYHVCIRPFDRQNTVSVYPFQLPHRLPRIPVPLLPGEESASVDLQAVFDECYDRGPYRREVNYAKDPPPPALSPERLAWVRNVIAKRK
jgi:hypothetical protein